MTAIAELTAGKSEISVIRVNNLGDRVIGIDTKGHLYIWRFNLLVNRQHYSTVIRRIDAVDACFTTNSSSIAILTKNSLFFYDLLKLEKFDLDHARVSSVSGGTMVRYLPKYRFCLVICGKKGKVETYDLAEKARVDVLDTGTKDILSCQMNDLGSMFSLGFSDGTIESYKSKGMRLANKFDPFHRQGGNKNKFIIFLDKKSSRAIVMMTIINGFLIAGTAGGIISIVSRM